MALSFQQTDISIGEADVGSCSVSNVGFWRISAGAAAGSLSHSAQIASAGASTAKNLSYATSGGVPGTATWVGACTIRLNITTANSNVTWVGARICERCAANNSTAATVTSALGISLGTTGVKTASVEITSAYTLSNCGTATAQANMVLSCSNAATMAATFNYINNQIITFPESASAAPAPSAIFTLAQMNVGQ